MKYLKYILALFLLLVIVFFAKGFLTPSIYYENVVVVNKPANVAWTVMSDESNLPKWISGFIRTEHISGTKNTVGAKSKIYVDENGQEMMMEETIIDIRTNELMVMNFTMDLMDMKYEMLFDEKNDVTTITTKSTTTGNGLFAKSMVSFMTTAMQSQEDVNLLNLKKLIEENTKDYFPKIDVDSTVEL